VVPANAAAEVACVSNDSQFRAILPQRSQDFGLLRDIAKAQKHVHLAQGNPRVTTADQVTARSLGWDQARFDEGRWDGPPQIVVTTDAGDLRYVEQIVVAAVVFLEAEMTRLQI
jgi:hypothetical protein